MPRKCSVFVATSLDGFIARPDGNIDWLEPAAGGPEDGDFGYQVFLDSVDALIMGRKTFEKVLSFPEWPYGKKQIIVLSGSLRDIPAAVPDTVRLLNLAPQQIIDQLAREGLSSFYVDGGVTIQRFLAAGLIDEMTITVIPVLLGTGIPLFGPLEADVPLKLLSSESYSCGFVQSRYSIDNRSQATRPAHP